MADIEKAGTPPPPVPAASDHGAQRDAPANAPEPRKEGSLVAWAQVLGAFCVYLNTWGMLNSFGVFETYYELDALSSQSNFAIGWIGSTQGALFFIASLVVGPLFDLGYFRSLLWLGTTLLVVGMFLLSVSHQFYQVLLTQSVLFGLGAGCVFLPAPAVVAQHFDAQLGLAISLASVGSAVGGLIYPAIFTRLLATVGFGWATRSIAFVVLGTSLFILLMKSKTKPAPSRSLIDWKAFIDLPYMLLNLGLVLGFMGLYVITTYLQLFALARTDVSTDLADNLLIILNAGSLIGRVVLGYYADMIGSIAMQTAVVLVATVLSFSLLAVHSAAGLVVITVFFGVASGTFLGLPVASIVRLSDDPGKIGTRIGMTLLFVGIGALIDYPIAGAIVSDSHNWASPVVYSGVLLAVSTVVLVLCRITKLGTKWTTPL
ncbi:major facilitator superfamily domain-containing protein [Xylariaceae sp. FL1651]|nr:major facilitator superfamily domain-containing protein [Xylariaceae sp. FL1651]